MGIFHYKKNKIKKQEILQQELKQFVKYWFKLQNYTLVLSLHAS